MKVTCDNCGILQESRWVRSGICIDCALSDDMWTEPATCVPGAVLQRAECVLCGIAIVAGELCTKCDEQVTRAYNRVFHG